MFRILNVDCERWGARSARNASVGERGRTSVKNQRCSRQTIIENGIICRWMENYSMAIQWTQIGNIEPRDYVCGYCGKRVGPDKGYFRAEIPTEMFRIAYTHALFAVSRHILTRTGRPYLESRTATRLTIYPTTFRLFTTRHVRAVLSVPTLLRS